MKDNLQEGLFGEACFPSKHTKITSHGWIRELEPKYVFYVDNDGFPFIIKRKEFEFTPKEFKDLSKKK